MTGLSALWLPILLSAVAVFLVSSLIHMASPWHKSDYPQMPNEDRVCDALRPLAIPPGDYFVPRPASRADLRSPAFLEKLKQGPIVFFTVLPNGPVAQGKRLVLWFVYAVAIGTFAAYVAGRAVPPGPAFWPVFGFAGVTAFLGYAAALWQMSIWYHRAWITTLKATLDGVVYAVCTAALLGWLWPH